MKLKDYAKEIAELAAKYPEANMIYSKDDEGNCFFPLQFSPSAGRFERGFWETVGELESGGKTAVINAVCVN